MYASITTFLDERLACSIKGLSEPNIRYADLATECRESIDMSPDGQHYM